jgi:hypothetical protein
MTQQTFQINGGIIEELLSMSPKNIGEPLRMSGDVIQMACAIGSLTLTKVEVSRSLRGEKTAAPEAVGHWQLVQEAAVAEGTGIGGGLKYLGTELMKGVAGFIAGSQKDL